MPGKLFPLGGPVSEHDIVDREDFIESLQIRLSEGQSVMLAGPRRIGKTSLALEIVRRLKEKGFYVATIDLFGIIDKKHLALTITDACLENRTGLGKTTTAIKDSIKRVPGMAKVALKINDLELDLRMVDQEKDADKLLSNALELPQVLAKKDKKQMVVVFDEFQDALRICGEGIFKIMRSHFQRHENVSYLFLGSKEGMMNSIFSDRKEAFYRFATILAIPEISEDAWIEYIQDKFMQRKIQGTNDMFREIVKLSGGHPQDTMLLCSEIYYTLLETDEQLLSYNLIKLGYERAMETLMQVFNEILDDVGAGLVRRTLIRIAKKEAVYPNAHPNEVKKAVDILVSKAIIEKNGRGVYQFIEPMFKEYILREIKIY